MKYVVRGKKVEAFNPERLFSSVLSSCLAVRVPDGEAHDLAARANRHIAKWLDDKTEISHHDLRRITAEFLRPFHADAAYYHETKGQII